MNDTNKYRDLFDKHNALSRFAGLIIVIVYICTYYMGLYTDKTIATEYIAYSSVAIMLVFGGSSVVTNNIGKVLDVIRKVRGR